MSPRKHANKGPCLLDLHKDTLVLVFYHLCGISATRTKSSTPLLRGSALEHARDAFALARTCNSLFVLFKNNFLRRIDAYPISHLHYSANVAEFPCSRYQSPSQISTIVGLAGQHLRELRLPSGGPWNEMTELVLRKVIFFCPGLHTLEFSDMEYLTTDLISSLLCAVALSLRNLTINNPQMTTLAQFSSARIQTLQHIKLTNFDPAAFHHLIHFIERQGKTLESLTIHFLDVDFYCAGKNSWDYSVNFFLLSFRAVDFLKCCPHLKSLDFAISPVNVSYVNDTLALDDVEYLNDAQAMDFGRALLRCGERNRPNGTYLEVVRISIFRIRSLFEGLLRDICTLVGPNTSVEVTFPGSSLLLHTPGSSNRFPLYRTLTMTHPKKLRQTVALSNREFDKVEDVRVPVFNVLDLSNSLAPLLLRTLRIKAGFNLKSLRIGFSDVVREGRLANNIRILLAEAPAITTLQLPRESLEHWSRIFPRAPQADVILSNLENLIFTTSPSCAIALRCESSIAAIPDLLYTIHAYSPKIQGVYWQSGMDSFVLGSCEIRQLLRTSLNYLEEFEGCRPFVDVSTIKSQLLIWMQRFY